MRTMQKGVFLILLGVFVAAILSGCGLHESRNAPCLPCGSAANTLLPETEQIPDRPLAA